MTTLSTAYRPYVPFFPSSLSGLFSVRFNGQKHELNGWEKTAIVITSVAGVLLAGVGVLLGFCLSHYFRSRLVDHLMAQPGAEKNHYFDAEYFDGTESETIAPVAATELFYQQKQISTFCSIHSLCNFAGHNVEGLVPKMIQGNNEYWINYFKNRPNGERDLQGMKNMGVYIESLQSIVKYRGVSTDTLTRYMTNNKDALHLPESCTIEHVSGAMDSLPVKTALQTIQANADLHRVIASVSNNSYAHFSTIRKDDAGQWRVLDSIQNIFASKTQLQPRFPTLEGAVQNLMTRHNGQSRDIQLIYPSKDTPANALKAIDEASPDLASA
jgi:hypothetical protein